MGLRARLRLGGVAALAAVLVACNSLTVDQSGVYTSSPTETITGTVEVASDDTLESLTVNGVEATIDGTTWSAEVPLDGEAIINPVLVEARYGSGQVIRERRTVVYGDGEHAVVLPEGAVQDDAVGLRLNERSFGKLGTVVKDLTTFDPGAIAPPGTVFMDECLTRIIVCTLHAKASTAGAPTIADFGVALDSHEGNVQAVVTLTDLSVPVRVDARVAGIPTSCALEVDAARVTIDGAYALEPDPADPHYLDVNLVGATPTVTLGNVRDDFVGGICSIPVIEQIVGLFMPDVEDMMETSLTSLLGDPDGSGPLDSPVADAVEQALSQLSIAGDIGGALGLDLESTITAADEHTDGIALRATAGFSAASVAPGAPDLTGSVAFPGEVLADLPATTPGGREYDVAVGASASGFNQLLAGETELGLLNVDVTELNGEPLTLRGLFDLIGAGGLITEDHPVVISLRPEVAPFVTTEPGPDGSIGEMRLGGYRTTISVAGDNPTLLLELVLDFRTGVGLELADDGLAFTFAQPSEDDLEATIIENPLGLPPALIEAVFAELAPQVFGSVKDKLPSFPLPQFAGLDLSLVEVNRVGSGFVLFADLVPAA
ncbi:MAG: hypothetical protein C0P77_007545 [Thermoanaerobacterales bacterium]|nr:hypothetical protein [Thermoanaerobacterales bacterium]